MDSKSSRANLKQYRRLNGKWQFVPVVKQDGKPNPKLVLLNGEPASSKGGTFYIEWRENGKRKQRPCGTTPREALDAWHLQSGILTGVIEQPAVDEVEPTKGYTSIDTAIADYLRDVKATKGPTTYRAYAHDLRWFRSICKKHLVARLDRSDAMALFAAGRDENLNQKTINKHVIVTLQAMRAAGASIDLRKGDWPKTTEKKVDIYQPEELTKFFAACNDEERLVFQVFLGTGFREREVANLAWTDIDWREGKLNVTAKPELGFSPKSYEERSVPVPRALIAHLRERKKASSSLLVFPSLPHPTKKECKGDRPENHMLGKCKEVALRAGLNCGHCEGVYTVYVMRKGVNHADKRSYCCATSPRCADWYLHKFRHTFATNMLQSVDIRNLQVLLGHKNISTTEKYLKTMRLEQLREKVENSSLAGYM
jgi:integrase/recombinase XerD